MAGFEVLAPDGSRLSADEFGAVDAAVWTGGDVLGLGIAGQAIVQGRFAVESLHARLRGLPPKPKLDGMRRPIGPEKILDEFYDRRPAVQPSRLPLPERLGSPAAEVTAGISEQEFLNEAGRCLSCGSCFGCQQCAMYCTPRCFTRLDHVGPGLYYSLSLDACEECGKCVAVCPCGYLELAPRT
jgi:ferredoxin